MFRSLVVAFSSLLIMVVLSVPHSTAQSLAQTPRLLSDTTLPESNSVKFPHIAVFGNTVHAVGNPNRSDAAYWSKADSAAGFGQPFTIGSTQGDPSFTNASVAVGPDGSLYAAWIDLDGTDGNSSIRMRRKPAGSDWEPIRTVVPGDQFRASVEIGVSAANTIFVIWREAERPVKYRASTNGGVSWGAGTFNVSTVIALGAPAIAAGRDGQVIVAYSGTDGIVYAASWTGSGFNNQVVSRTPSGGTLNTDVTVAIAPNGRAYVAWRNTANGAFFAERQTDGSWPNARLVGGRVEGTVSISADELNNLHMFWISNVSGPFAVFYAFKAVNADWQGPILIQNRGAFVANVRGATSIGSLAYAHAVYERFTGSRLSSGYYLLDSVAPNLVNARPVIEGGAAVTNKTVVNVNFAAVFGLPTQVRWRWGAAPTDAANDSGGWRPFANSIAVPLPAVSTPAVCQPLTLFTQVRAAQGTIQATAEPTRITFDGAAQAAVNLVNPGVGDAAFTPVNEGRLEVFNTGDCSGLASVAAGTAAFPVVGNSLITALPLPGAGEGLKTVGIAVTDRLGNTISTNRSITYDGTAPAIAASGTVSVTSRPDATLVTDVRVSGTVISDTIYPPSHAWGLEIAVSRVPTTTLTWSAPRQLPPLNSAATPPGSLDFSLCWNLANSLPRAALTPGDYYIYLRFRDGAGNPTPQTIVGRVTLNEITYPKIYTPVIRR